MPDDHQKYERSKSQKTFGTAFPKGHGNRSAYRRQLACQR